MLLQDEYGSYVSQKLASEAELDNLEAKLVRPTALFCIKGVWAEAVRAKLV